MLLISDGISKKCTANTNGNLRHPTNIHMAKRASLFLMGFAFHLLFFQMNSKTACMYLILLQDRIYVKLLKCILQLNTDFYNISISQSIDHTCHRHREVASG